MNPARRTRRRLIPQHLDRRRLLTAELIAEVEPNDDSDRPQLVAISGETTIDGRIDAGTGDQTDADRFRIDLTEGGPYRITVDVDPDRADQLFASAEVFSRFVSESDAQFIASEVFSTSPPGRLFEALWLPSGGSYLVDVSGESDETIESPIDYQIRILPQSFPEIMFSDIEVDTLQQPTFLGVDPVGSFTGTVGGGIDERDTFLMVIPPGSRTVLTGSTSTEGRLGLRAESLDSLTSDAFSVSTDPSLDLSDSDSTDPLPAGTYSIEVFQLGSESGVADYRLDFSTVEAVSADRLEPNDAPENSTPLIGGDFDGTELTIDDGRDVDWFELMLDRDGLVGDSIQIDFDGGAADLDLELFDADGEFLDGSFDTDDVESISLAGLAPGVYRAAVYAFDGFATPYRLTVTLDDSGRNPDGDPPRPITLRPIADRTLDVDTEGLVIPLTIDPGTAGTLDEFSVTAISSNPSVISDPVVEFRDGQYVLRFDPFGSAGLAGVTVVIEEPGGQSVSDVFTVRSIDAGDFDGVLLLPNRVERPHLIPAGQPAALLFTAARSGPLTFRPVGVASVSRDITVRGADGVDVGSFRDGYLHADVIGGRVYAAVFDAAPVDRIYSVVGPDGTSLGLNLAPTNILTPADVDGDGDVSPLDALSVLNFMRRSTSEGESNGGPSAASPPPHRFTDVDGDGRVSPLDALTVLNEIRRRRFTAGTITAGRASPAGEAIMEGVSEGTGVAITSIQATARPPRQKTRQLPSPIGNPGDAAASLPTKASVDLADTTVAETSNDGTDRWRLLNDQTSDPVEPATLG